MPTQADIDHAAFVRQALRYVTVEAAEVRARNPDAREVVIDTNLDLASATVLANRILAENAQPRAYEIILEGADITSLSPGPPTYVINSAKLGTDGTARRAFSITFDLERNRTTTQVRG